MTPGKIWKAKKHGNVALKLSRSLVLLSLVVFMGCVADASENGRRNLEGRPRHLLERKIVHRERPTSGADGSPQDVLPEGPGGSATSSKSRPTKLGIKRLGGHHVSSRAAVDPVTSGGSGTVMANGVNVYIIWYGSWSMPRVADASAKVIIRNFIKSLGAPLSSFSPTIPNAPGWYAIATQYYNFQKKHVTPTIVLKGESANVNFGGNIRNTSWAGILTRMVGTGKTFPIDVNGLYLILTSPEIKVQDFCTNACGYHDHTKLYGVELKWAFIGNPATQCANGCATRYYEGSSKPPNKNVGADAMVDTIAHEIVEAATDPYLDNWGNSAGDEIADICGDYYGKIFTTPTAHVVAAKSISSATGSENYNIVGLNNQKFLIQSNYDLLTRSCRIQASNLKFPPKAPPPSPRPAPPAPKSMGTYFTLSTLKYFKGTIYIAKAPLANKCINIPKANWAINSLLVIWNKNDGIPDHVGCGNFTLWDEADCYGDGSYWELPSRWNPKKFDYPNLSFTDFKSEDADLATQTRSISCDVVG
eukprot:jgi/Mesen1/478/ME000101S10697